MSGLTDWLQATGSWGQALGTIGAIIYAYRLADRQRRIQYDDERELLRLKSRALALFTRQPLEEWQRRVDGAVGIPERRVPHDTINEFRLRNVFDVPAPIWSKLSDLHILGQAGDELLSAIATAHEGSAVMSQFESTGGPDDKFVESLSSQLKHLQHHLMLSSYKLLGAIDRDVARTRRSDDD